MINSNEISFYAVKARNSIVSESIKKMIDKFIEFIKKHVTIDNALKIAVTAAVLILMAVILKFIKKGLKKVLPQKLGVHYSTIAIKLVDYLFYIIAAMYVLNLFGVKLSAIWGFAGITGIAIGFAAQTSISNIISGLFVLGEKSIKIGDFIIVDGVSGTVDSIDLLSCHVHTRDNQMIRIPNSTIINSNMQNNNYFGIRRLTFPLTITHDSDMEKALEVLKKIPTMCPSVLKDPETIIWFDDFGERGINLVLAVWMKTTDFIIVKNEVLVAVKKLFDEAGIKIPYYKLNISLKDKE